MWAKKSTKAAAAAAPHAPNGISALSETNVSHDIYFPGVAPHILLVPPASSSASPQANGRVNGLLDDPINGWAAASTSGATSTTTRSPTTSASRGNAAGLTWLAEGLSTANAGHYGHRTAWQVKSDPSVSALSSLVVPADAAGAGGRAAGGGAPWFQDGSSSRHAAAEEQHHHHPAWQLNEDGRPASPTGHVTVSCLATPRLRPTATSAAAAAAASSGQLPTGNSSSRGPGKKLWKGVSKKLSAFSVAVLGSGSSHKLTKVPVPPDLKVLVLQRMRSMRTTGEFWSSSSRPASAEYHEATGSGSSSSMRAELKRSSSVHMGQLVGSEVRSDENSGQARHAVLNRQGSSGAFTKLFPSFVGQKQKQPQPPQRQIDSPVDGISNRQIGNEVRMTPRIVERERSMGGLHDLQQKAPAEVNGSVADAASDWSTDMSYVAAIMSSSDSASNSAPSPAVAAPTTVTAAKSVPTAAKKKLASGSDLECGMGADASAGSLLQKTSPQTSSEQCDYAHVYIKKAVADETDVQPSSDTTSFQKVAKGANKRGLWVDTNQTCSDDHDDDDDDAYEAVKLDGSMAETDENGGELARSPSRKSFGAHFEPSSASPQDANDRAAIMSRYGVDTPRFQFSRLDGSNRSMREGNLWETIESAYEGSGQKELIKRKAPSQSTFGIRASVGRGSTARQGKAKTNAQSLGGTGSANGLQDVWVKKTSPMEFTKLSTSASTDARRPSSDDSLISMSFSRSKTLHPAKHSSMLQTNPLKSASVAPFMHPELEGWKENLLAASGPLLTGGIHSSPDSIFSKGFVTPRGNRYIPSKSGERWEGILPDQVHPIHGGQQQDALLSTKAKGGHKRSTSFEEKVEFTAWHLDEEKKRGHIGTSVGRAHEGPQVRLYSFAQHLKNVANAEALEGKSDLAPSG